jgi:hypothetical protein
MHSLPFVDPKALGSLRKNRLVEIQKFQQSSFTMKMVLFVPQEQKP